jgi:hypothetical protein
MNYVNLTPHTINILEKTVQEGGYKEVLSIPPSGIISRLAVRREIEATIDGVVFYKSVFGDPDDLPPKTEGTIYIVSSLFRSGFDREDLWVPGELVRDEAGKPIGCLGLSR